jgi:hypothetical protein
MSINDMLFLTLVKNNGDMPSKESLKELLEKNTSEPIEQEYQDIIVENYKKLLIYIRGITGETLIKFCKTYRDERKRGLLTEDVALLFEVYERDIKPRKNDFVKSEFTSELKKELLDNISEDTVMCLSENSSYQEIKGLYMLIEATKPVEKGKAKEKADDK